MDMNTYEIVRTDTAPDWENIPTLQVSQVLWLPDAGIRMTQQLCYDDSALYVRQRAWERELRAEGRDPLCAVCEDSCMEFFFALSSDGRYFNLEVNPNGCIYFGFGTERGNRLRLLPEAPAALFGLHTALCTDGWEAVYRLPLHLLRLFYPDLSLTEGFSFTANCYKCGDRTVHPHYLAWNRVESDAPDFHRPCDFGRMLLRRELP